MTQPSPDTALSHSRLILTEPALFVVLALRGQGQNDLVCLESASCRHGGEEPRLGLGEGRFAGRTLTEDIPGDAMNAAEQVVCVGQVCRRAWTHPEEEGFLLLGCRGRLSIIS